MISLDNGKKLIKLARKSVKSYFENKEIKDNEFKEKGGVFVSLKLDDQLRGCVGFPDPVLELSKAVIQAARLAAFKDSRFDPLKEKEFDKVSFEVSVLTKPVLIKVKNHEDYFKEIEIGKDGLIAETGIFRGLLLPQVAVENKWTIEEFLNYTCLKAGLLQDTWKQPVCKIYKFQSEIFKEAEPNKEVIKK